MQNQQLENWWRLATSVSKSDNAIAEQIEQWLEGCEEYANSKVGAVCDIVKKDWRDVVRLKNLYLYNNQLTSLPAEIGNLAALEWLHLSDNQLTSLPTEIGNLAALKWLSLNNNQLTSLPTEIGNLAALERLSLNKQSNT